MRSKLFSIFVVCVVSCVAFGGIGNYANSTGTQGGIGLIVAGQQNNAFAVQCKSCWSSNQLAAASAEQCIGGIGAFGQGTEIEAGNVKDGWGPDAANRAAGGSEQCIVGVGKAKAQTNALAKQDINPCGIEQCATANTTLCAVGGPIYVGQSGYASAANSLNQYCSNVSNGAVAGGEQQAYGCAVMGAQYRATAAQKTSWHGTVQCATASATQGMAGVGSMQQIAQASASNQN